MHAARLPSILVLVAVVVAGCSGPVADATPGAPDGTATPTPSVPADADRPPGVDRTGLADPGRLLDAHEAALDRADASHVHATRRVVRGSGETVRTMNRTVHRGTVRGWEVLRVRETARLSGGPYELFGRGPAVVRRNLDHAGGDSPAYEYRYGATGDGNVSAGDPVDGPIAVATAKPSAVLAVALAWGDFRVTNVTDEVVTLAVTGPASDANLSEYSATLEVTSAGLVRHLEAEMTRADDGTEPDVWHHAEFSYEADLDVGPPSTPGWTSEVPQLALTLNGNRTVLAVEHRAGAALPEGTELSVGVATPDGPVHEEGLSLPERLEGSPRGSTAAAYVYAVRTGEGVDLRISADRPATNASFAPLADGDVVVSHFGQRLQFELRLEPADEE